MQSTTFNNQPPSSNPQPPYTPMQQQFQQNQQPMNQGQPPHFAQPPGPPSNNQPQSFNQPPGQSFNQPTGPPASFNQPYNPNYQHQSAQQFSNYSPQFAAHGTPAGFQNTPPTSTSTPVNYGPPINQAGAPLGYPNRPPGSTPTPLGYAPASSSPAIYSGTPSTRPVGYAQSPPITGSPAVPYPGVPTMGTAPPPPPPHDAAPSVSLGTNRRKLYPDQMAQAYGAGAPSFNSEQNLYQNQQPGMQPGNMGQPPSQYAPNNAPYAGAAPQQYPQQYPQQQQGMAPPPGMSQLTNGMSTMSIGTPTNGINPSAIPAPPGQQQMYPGQPPAGGGVTPQKNKIDPNNIPSPVDVQIADQVAYASTPFRTCSKTMPPLPATRFTVLDEGVASPRFLRMTTHNVPATDDLLAQSMLPLGCVVQPLAELEAGEAEIEVIRTSNTAQGGPPRCRRCRAYINPMMLFTQGGRKFVCNLCQMENEVPPEYFCNVDMNGRRIDIMQRPELRCGTVEYIAGKEFYLKPPQPISYVIAIDVSWNSVQSGLLAQLSMIVRDWLYSDGSEQRFPRGGRVAILTYDRSVQFYNFHASLDQYQMLVVPDFDDMFVPMSTGFLVDPFESRPVIESFLDALPTLFQENRVADSVLGAVVLSVINHLSECGGRILVFHSCLPATGPGALKNREDPKLYGTEKEHKLFETAEPFYLTLAKDAVAAGVCIDLFLFPYSYMDVASIGTLSLVTGGSTILYPQFQLDRDGAKLHTDVLRSLTRQFGYNALMRVRVSTGLRVVDHLGSYYTKDGVDIELAGIDADKAIAVALKHDGKLDENQDSVIQVALLYTTVTGERRIRIHTVALTNTSQLGNVFRFAELDTTVNYLAKSSMSAVMTEAVGSVRGLLTEKCVKVLASYRKNCASTTSPGQLILPETFKLFPLCTLALHKNKALRAGDLVSDLRVAAMRELRSVPVSLSVPLLYPRMYALHHGDPNRPGYPVHMRISYERLEAHGCYLLENSHLAMVWIGRQASQELIQDLFGVNTLEEINLRMHVIPPRETEINSRLQLQVGEIAMRYRRHLSISIVRQGMDQSELEFLANMIEDKNHDAMSYVDFLVFVHRQIHSEARNSRETVSMAAAAMAMQYSYGIGASRAH